jgi:cytochrome c oxidase subunit 2
MIPSGVSHVRRALAVLALLASGVAFANPEPWQLNLTPGVTSISQRIYQLHMLGFYVCLGIGFIVFGAMFIAMFKFRKSKGAVAEQWSHSTKLLVDMANTENADMTIKITGYQWKWRYEYVDYNKKNTGVNFISSLDADSNRTRQLGSGLDPRAVKDGDYESYLLNVDKPLVVPTGVKIRFVITGDDVIHAWWVPQLGWKQDAIPGIINSTWTEIPTPGVYRGQCAELCGKDHGFMPIVVKAVQKSEFESWLANEQSAEGVNKAAATADNAAPAAPTTPPQG